MAYWDTNTASSATVSSSWTASEQRRRPENHRDQPCRYWLSVGWGVTLSPAEVSVMWMGERGRGPAAQALHVGQGKRDGWTVRVERGGGWLGRQNGGGGGDVG